ncbi:MAG: hypothetical protein ACRCST_01535 [Turicibacter sp.]
MKNLIRRILRLDTTRYFIVFYTFTENRNIYNGSCSICVTEKDKFLNPKQMDEKLRMLNGTNEIHIITGFNEVSKREYEIWSMTDI